MRCFVQTHLTAPADAVWAAVKKPQTLVHVTRGFLGFSGSDRFPAVWNIGQKLETRLWFFHILPGWKHILTVAEVNDNEKLIRSHEYSGFYTWDHIIRVADDSSGCGYSDEIEIRAGLMTLFIWLFANVFYRYRQMRWRKLARSLNQ
jgi:ligand-binding SRPBCC domain-containing protein